MAISSRPAQLRRQEERKEKEKKKRETEKETQILTTKKKSRGGVESVSPLTASVKVKTVLIYLILTLPIHLRCCHWEMVLLHIVFTLFSKLPNFPPQIQCSSIIQNQISRDQNKACSTTQWEFRARRATALTHYLQSFSSQVLDSPPSLQVRNPGPFLQLKPAKQIPPSNQAVLLLTV